MLDARPTKICGRVYFEEDAPSKSTEYLNEIKRFNTMQRSIERNQLLCYIHFNKRITDTIHTFYIQRDSRFSTFEDSTTLIRETPYKLKNFIIKLFFRRYETILLYISGFPEMYIAKTGNCYKFFIFISRFESLRLNLI